MIQNIRKQKKTKTWKTDQQKARNKQARSQTNKKQEMKKYWVGSRGREGPTSQTDGEAGGWNGPLVFEWVYVLFLRLVF